MSKATKDILADLIKCSDCGRVFNADTEPVTIFVAALLCEACAEKREAAK